MITVSVKEEAWVAYIAARFLGVKQVAIVFNRTIYLHNTGYDTFISKQSWVLHELKHVEQYQRYGRIRFLALYIYESMRNGYQQNRWEVEARNAENEYTLLEKYKLSTTGKRQ